MSLSGTADRGRLKEAFLTRLWGGALYGDYLADARRYADESLDGMIIPLARRVFMKHIERGDLVLIVTASMPEWVGGWAGRYGVTVIGTLLEVADGRLTGRLATPNCRGAEKVARVRAQVDLDGYSRIFAYGDSRGDREMLAAADEAVYRWNRTPRV
jgi:HAD superfamily hydrolase (TIGR01490 family)